MTHALRKNGRREEKKKASSAAWRPRARIATDGGCSGRQRCDAGSEGGISTSYELGIANVYKRRLRDGRTDGRRDLKG